jgi:hypothetical protein
MESPPCGFLSYLSLHAPLSTSKGGNGQLKTKQKEIKQKQMKIFIDIRKVPG